MVNRKISYYENLWQKCRQGAIEYITSLHREEPWFFSVSKFAEKPIAIASATAVLLLSFLDALNDIPLETKKSWLAYLQSFQTEDGLFEDKTDMAEETQGYPYWALRAHRTRHIAWAIEALGGKLKYPIAFVKPYIEKGSIEKWFEELWQKNNEKIWSVGNWVMDMGVLLDLQYRHFNQPNAADALCYLLKSLSKKQDSNTGYWLAPGTDLRCSMAGAMHFYPLYWAYSYPLSYFENAVENTLKLQQPDGLFGFESGTGSCQCLDYDAMLILANGYHLFGDKQQQIQRTCSKVIDAIMINHNDDGSFADSQVDQIRYWTTKAAAYHANGGSLWDTYARLMTIAMALEIVTKQLPAPMKCEHHLFEIFHSGQGWTKGKHLKW